MIHAAIVVLLALAGCKVDGAAVVKHPLTTASAPTHTVRTLDADPRQVCQPGERPAFVVLRPGSPDEWVHLQRCKK